MKIQWDRKAREVEPTRPSVLRRRGLTSIVPFLADFTEIGRPFLLRNLAVGLKGIVGILALILFTSSAQAQPDARPRLRVGVYNNPPKVFYDDQGHGQGFWGELTETIAHREGWKIVWVPGTWEECMQRLGDGRIDVMVDVAITPDREKRFAFGKQTVHVSWSRVYSSVGENIQTIPDLQGKTIAALDDSVNLEGPDGLRILLKKFAVKATILTKSSYDQVFESLDSGEVDAAITNRDFGNRMEERYKVVRTPILIQPADLRFAYSSETDRAALINAFDSQLMAMKADPNSRYYRLQEQWLGLARPRNLIPEWLEWTLYSLLGAVVLLLAGVLVVELRVRNRTRQIRMQKSALEEQDRQLTEQNRNLSELLQSRRALLDSVPAHIALLDFQGQILSVNHQWSTFHRKQSYFGVNYPESGNYIALCQQFAPMESEGIQIARGVESVLSGKESRFSMEYPLHSPERLQWFRMMVNSLASDSARDASHGAVVMHIDITERKVADLELNRLAFQDPVTGLPSRNGFVRSMRGRIERAGWKPEGVLLVMDVVSMRDINDAHGYEIGDQFLLNLSHRLREEAGHDGLAGRTGGDEFVLYLPIGDADGSSHTPDSFFRVMAEPFLIAEVEVVVSVRFGYTVLGETRRSVECLLREAELALFRAREEVGQSWKAYTSDMDAATRERIELTREIRNALRNHQFEMYYQPKVALSEGTVVGCEALIRWNHPQNGMQSPAVFIPVAEKSQLIAPLGYWILEEVCHQLRQWTDLGLEAVPVAINVSIVQFRGGDFPDRVAALLEKYSISPTLLAFEVTESVFEKESILLQSQIQRLREMGIRLSLDDFGTGYSSLQYLQNYAFDEIKIDQGFVRNMSERASEKIVETILGLSAAFHADVVAEGIETEEVRDRLIALGCTYGQGYFYSRPVPALEFAEILKDKRIKRSA